MLTKLTIEYEILVIFLKNPYIYFLEFSKAAGLIIYDKMYSAHTHAKPYF